MRAGDRKTAEFYTVPNWRDPLNEEFHSQLGVKGTHSTFKGHLDWGSFLTQGD